MNCEHETVIIGDVRADYCSECIHHDSDPDQMEGLPCSLDDMEITENLMLVDSWFVCGCFKKKDS